MYKTIILKNSYKEIVSGIDKYFKYLDTSGSLFAICETEYLRDHVKNDFLDVISYGIKKKLYYVNTIIIPYKTTSVDNILYCVWFCKNRNELYFDKDKIREKHIWKDVEWGRRAKNYNSKGKDPGNVWIPTTDDGKAHITSHILLNSYDIYDRLLLTTMHNSDKYIILSNIESDKKYHFNKFDGKVLIKHSNIFKIDDFKYITKKTSKKSLSINANVFFETSEKMSNIKDNTVTTIVTSPPYWDLKNYYKKNQIGQESYETYSKRIFSVWKECYKKLKKDGSFWININIRVKEGNVILLPKLFIEQCKKIGFLYKGILVWHKSSGIPTSSKNIVDHHEYVLIFTKSKTNRIKSFKNVQYNDYFNIDMNNKMLWNINRKAGSVGKKTIHPAIFPTKLIDRIIDISSDIGDIIMDPFLGSGTSLIAAINNDRNFIGYEFNDGFKDLMIDRFNKEIKKNIEIKYFKQKNNIVITNK